MREALTLTTTLSIMAASVVAIVGLIWYEKRPREFGQMRLVPTTPLIFLMFLVLILMAAHLLTLMGANTGR